MSKARRFLAVLCTVTMLFGNVAPTGNPVFASGASQENEALDDAVLLETNIEEGSAEQAAEESTAPAEQPEAVKEVPAADDQPAETVQGIEPAASAAGEVTVLQEAPVEVIPAELPAEEQAGASAPAAAPEAAGEAEALPAAEQPSQEAQPASAEETLPAAEPAATAEEAFVEVEPAASVIVEISPDGEADRTVLQDRNAIVAVQVPAGTNFGLFATAPSRFRLAIRTGDTNLETTDAMLPEGKTFFTYGILLEAGEYLISLESGSEVEVRVLKENDYNALVNSPAPEQQKPTEVSDNQEAAVPEEKGEAEAVPSNNNINTPTETIPEKKEPAETAQDASQPEDGEEEAAVAILTTEQEEETAEIIPEEVEKVVITEKARATEQEQAVETIPEDAEKAAATDETQAIEQEETPEVIPTETEIEVNAEKPLENEQEAWEEQTEEAVKEENTEETKEEKQEETEAEPIEEAAEAEAEKKETAKAEEESSEEAAEAEAEPEEKETVEAEAVETAEEPEEVQEEEPALFEGTLTKQGYDFTVTAVITQDAGFPADVTLRVREVFPGTAEYKSYLGLTDEELSKDWNEVGDFARILDISFWSGEVEVQPQAYIDVQVTFHEAISVDEESDLKTFHFGANGTEEMNSQTSSEGAAKHDDSAVDSVSFSTNSFSVYVFVKSSVTKTKTISANGKTYEISVTYSKDAKIPDTAEVKVSEITESNPDYEYYRMQAAAALKSDDVILPGLYDISLYDGQTKIEPADPVQVSIRLADAAAVNSDEELHIVHFPDGIEAAKSAEVVTQQIPASPEATEDAPQENKSQAQVVNMEVIQPTVEGQTVTFDAQSFSVYALAYTVEYIEINYNGVINLDFTGFEPYPKEGVDATFIYDTDNCDIRVSVESVLSIALNAEAAGDGVISEKAEIENFEIDWTKVETVSAKGGVALEEGALVISGDGSIVLSDGEKTLTINITGITKLSEEILKADGVEIKVEEGNIPLGSQAQYTQNSEEKTASLVEEHKLGEGEENIAGYSSADLKIVRNDEEVNAEGQFKVTLDKSSLVPEGMKLDKLFHIHDGQVEELAVTETEERYVFQVENFSDIVASYTVEFHIGDSEYVLQGMENVLLSEILAFIDIDFTIDDVIDVVFSNPDLLAVEPIDGDWRLTSLLPFLTHETLTLVLPNEKEFVIDVTDAIEVHTNLADFLHSEDTDPPAVVFTINGQEVGDDAPSVRAGDSYSLTLNFREVNGGAQFPIDGTEMTYILPAALADVQNLSGTHTTFSMELGTSDKGQPIILDGNEVWVEDGTNGEKILKVKWNTESENFSELISAGDAHLQVIITGKITPTNEPISFAADIDKNVTVDNSHELTVNKYGNYNEDTGMVDYTINVNSTGTNEDVTITDTIRGTALVNPTDAAYTIYRADGTTETGTCNFADATVDGKTCKQLVKNFGTLNNGDRIEIHYSTGIDTTKITGRGTAEQTVNDVKVDNKDDQGEPDPISTNLENRINWLSFWKQGEEIPEGSNGNKKIVKWIITANEKMLTSLAGKTITDIITSPDVMRYVPTNTVIGGIDCGGICVHVYDTNGLKEDRVILWGDTANGLTAYDPATWTYTVPASDGNYKYVIEYRTEVDVSGRINDLGVSNKVEVDGITQQGYTNVNPGDDNVEIHKTHNAASVTYQHTDWQVYFDVPANGLSSAVVEDYLPVCNVNGVNVYDELDVTQYTDGIQVTGLNTTEYNGRPYEKYTLEVDYSNSSMPLFRIRFQKLDTETGEYEDGLMSGSTRTITINYRTNTNEDWVDAYKPDDGRSKHTNTARLIVGNQSVQTSDQATPPHMGIEKSGGNTYSTVNIDGREYPLYWYSITLYGETRQSFSLTDVYDPLLQPYDKTDDATQRKFYTNLGSGDVYAEQKATITDDASTHTMTISVENADQLPAGANGLYYVFRYYMIPRDLDEFRQASMNDAQISGHDGKIKLNNSINWGDYHSDVDIDYKYDVVKKEASNPYGNNRVWHFKITLNPDKLTIGSTEMLEMKDTFENLSIDYSSIQFTTVDPEANRSKITYDFRGYTGTFQIPNATKVVVEYDARVIGDGNINIRNTANLAGYRDSTEQTTYNNIQTAGGATNYKIRIFKYQAGHMEAGLSGAVFKLMEKDSSGNLVEMRYPADYAVDESLRGQPITFTTGSNGYVTVAINSAEVGFTLEKNKPYWLIETNPPTGYEQDYIQYSFEISNNADYDKKNGVYRYHNNDIMKISNKTDQGGLVIVKGLDGINTNILTAAERETLNNIVFTVTGIFDQTIETANNSPLTGKTWTKDDGTGVYTITLHYSDFTDGRFWFNPEFVQKGQTYTVTETNADVEGYQRVTTYNADGTAQGSTTASVTFTPADFGNNINTKSHHLIVNNTYSTHAYSFKKQETKTAQMTDDVPVAGAKFKVFEWNGSEWVDINKVYTTDEEGEFGIRWIDRDYKYNTAYYVVETQAPEGYEISGTPTKYYFWFNDNTQQPTTHVVPASFSGVNLCTNDNSETVYNNRVDIEKTSLTIGKSWKTLENADISKAELDAKGVKSVQVTIYQKSKVGEAFTAEELADQTGGALYTDANHPDGVFTIIPDSYGNWNLTINNLPKTRTVVGTEEPVTYYSYYVKEEVVLNASDEEISGWQLKTKTAGVSNISLTNMPEETYLKVMKKWVMPDSIKDIFANLGVKLKLYRDLRSNETADTANDYLDPITGKYWKNLLINGQSEVTLKPNIVLTISNLTKGDVFHIVETDVDSSAQDISFYTTTITDDNNLTGGDDLVTITNTYHSPELIVRKRWITNNGEPANGGVTVYVKRKVLNPDGTPGADDTTFNNKNIKVELKPSNNWTAQLPDSNYNLEPGYWYYVEESNYGFKVEYSTGDVDHPMFLTTGDIGDVTVTNTVFYNETGVKVRKLWLNADGTEMDTEDCPQSVTVQLKRATKNVTGNTVTFNVPYHYTDWQGNSSSGTVEKSEIVKNSDGYVTYKVSNVPNTDATDAQLSASNCTASLSKENGYYLVRITSITGNASVTFNLANAAYTTFGPNVDMVSSSGPESITYGAWETHPDNLLNGDTSEVVLNSTNNWEKRWNFTTDSNYVYTVVETEINGVAIDPNEYHIEWETSYTGITTEAPKIPSGLIYLKNTQIKGDITVEKTWNGADTWPEDVDSVVMTLHAKDVSGAEITGNDLSAILGSNQQTLTLDSAHHSQTWTNLPKYQNMSAQTGVITYYVEETAINYTVASGNSAWPLNTYAKITRKYRVTVDDTMMPTGGVETGYGTATVDNSQTSIEVHGTKTWLESTPTVHDYASEITLTLKRRLETDADEETSYTVYAATPTWESNRYSFDGLPQFDGNGVRYIYKVEETPIAGYAVVQNGNDIVNSEVTQAVAVKTWDMGEDPFFANAKVTLALQSRSRAITGEHGASIAVEDWPEDDEGFTTVDPAQEIVLTGAEATSATWTHTFTGLPKYSYDPDTGVTYELQYSVKEIKVEVPKTSEELTAEGIDASTADPADLYKDMTTKFDPSYTYANGTTTVLNTYNKEGKVKVTVEKRWAGIDVADLNGVTASFQLKRYKTGAVSSAATVRIGVRVDWNPGDSDYSQNAAVGTGATLLYPAYTIDQYGNTVNSQGTLVYTWGDDANWGFNHWQELGNTNYTDEITSDSSKKLLTINAVPNSQVLILLKYDHSYAESFVAASVLSTSSGIPTTEVDTSFDPENTLTVTLPHNGSWSYTFPEQDKASQDGSETYTYFVEETGVNGISGYTVEYHRDEENNIIGTSVTSKQTITNRLTGRAKINVVKVDAANNAVKLPGAVFTLSKPDGSTQQKTTNANGTLSFSGLTQGNYTLTETTPPTGYKSSLTGPITFTVGSDGSVTYSGSDSAVTYASNTFTVKNPEKTAKLVITKNIATQDDAGNAAQTLIDANAALKQAIAFTVTDSHGDTVASFTYADMTNGVKTLTKADGIVYGETYTVTESIPANHLNSSQYELISTVIAVNGAAGTEVSSADVALVDVTGQEVDAVGAAEITNTYDHEKGTLTVTKAVQALDGVTVNANKKFYFTVKNAAQKYITDTGAAQDAEYVFEITAAQTVTISNLPTGNYTVTELYTSESDTVPDGKESALVEGTILTVSGGGRVTVYKGTTTPSTLNNVYRPGKGKLTITKMFDGDHASALTIEQKNAISFTVSGPDGYTATKTYQEIYAMTDHEWTLDNLDPGDYTVTETNANPNSTAYTLETTYSVDSSAYTATNTVTISAGDDKTLDIKNIYTENPGSLTITKAIVGAESTMDTFTFEVTFTKDSSALTSSVKLNGETTTLVNGKLTVTITGAGSANITDIPAGTSYVVEETRIPTGWEQTGNVAISGGDGDQVIDPGETETATITNTKQISIYAQKVWTQNGTNLTGWPADVTSVTFQLQERTDAQSAWTDVAAPDGVQTVSDLTAVHWGNLTPTKEYQVVETKITKTDETEQTVNIVASSGSGTEALPFVITNTVDTISIPVEKNWTGTPPAGTTVVVELVKVENGNEVSFDPAKTLTLQASSTESENWKGTFTGLEKYNADGTAITYKVMETKVTYLGQDYTGTNLTTAFSTTGKESNAISSTGTISTVTIQNTVETTTISAKKTWNGSDAAADWPADMSVTFTLSASTGTIPTTTDGTYSANTPSVTINSQQTVEWTNLPKWTIVEGVATEITYSVSETAVMYNGTSIVNYRTIYTVTGEGSGTEGLVIINNQSQTTERHATKTWVDSAGQTIANPPESITFTLSATYDNNGTETAIDLGTYGVAAAQQVVTITPNAETGVWPTADWTGLPVYTNDGALITYDVNETAVTNYTQTGKVWNEGTNTWTFTNTLNETNLKIVKEDGNTHTPLTGAVFSLEKQNASGTYETVTAYASFTVNSTDGVTLTGLTDGNYRLTETQAPAGYNALTQAIEFTIANGVVNNPGTIGYTAARAAVAADPENNVEAQDAVPATFTIGNTPGVELPSTGGMGTLPYTLTGLTLLLGASLWLLLRRRREQN